MFTGNQNRFLTRITLLIPILSLGNECHHFFTGLKCDFCTVVLSASVLSMFFKKDHRLLVLYLVMLVDSRLCTSFDIKRMWITTCFGMCDSPDSATGQVSKLAQHQICLSQRCVSELDLFMCRLMSGGTVEWTTRAIAFSASFVRSDKKIILLSTVLALLDISRFALGILCNAVWFRVFVAELRLFFMVLNLRCRCHGHGQDYK